MKNCTQKKLYPVLLFAVLICNCSYSQTGINTFTYINNAPGAGNSYTGNGGGIGAQVEYLPISLNTFTYQFGTASGFTSGLLAVNGYIAGNTSYAVISNIITSVVMRRVNNSVITGNRDILFFAGNRTPAISVLGLTLSPLTLNLNAPYIPDMSTAFFQNNLLIGTDNIFSNQGNGNGNNNNIERVDVMIGGGYQILNAQKSGFPILERGVYGAHDAYKVAVITAIDASGNPAAYSNVVSVINTNYNNVNTKNPVADGTYTYFLFRRDGTNPLEANQHINNQGIGGVAMRFSDFGIADGATIYGYSIMANDFNSIAGADVIDYTNASHYPTNTNETAGGLDLLAVIGIGFETVVLPVEMSSFIAAQKNASSELKWTTATEINNRGFDIERSANGKDWNKIGYVPSQTREGNSIDKLEYNYYDNAPASGINYYRLKQIDINGRERISRICIVSFGNDNSNTIVFPNPAANNIYVHGVKPGTDLQLVNMKGAPLSRITTKTPDATIAADKLNPGVYFLQMIRNNEVVNTIKVIKM